MRYSIIASDSDNLLQLSEVHLQGVANDAIEMQAHHYRKATELVYLALNISARIWGSHDSRRLDLYYRLVKQIYLQSLAVDRRDDTAYALRAIVPGSSWVRGTYQSHISVIEEFTLLDSEENPTIDTEYLNNRLHFLRFRPRLENGMAQASDGTLLYRTVR